MEIQGSITSWVEEVRKILGSEFFKENVHSLPVRNPMGAKHSYTLLLTMCSSCRLLVLNVCVKFHEKSAKRF